jgi:hypothetical protein
MAGKRRERRFLQPKALGALHSGAEMVLGPAKADLRLQVSGHDEQAPGRQISPPVKVEGFPAEKRRKRLQGPINGMIIGGGLEKDFLEHGGLREAMTRARLEHRLERPRGKP